MAILRNIYCTGLHKYNRGIYYLSLLRYPQSTFGEHVINCVYPITRNTLIKVLRYINYLFILFFLRDVTYVAVTKKKDVSK